MMNEVKIRTGSRLHFGLLSHGQTDRREFGGVGVMIDQPGFAVRIARADADHLECGAWQTRIATLTARLREAFACGPVRIEISGSPPPHAGLGSGTQLGMALAQGLSLLAGETNVPATELARRAGRGARSALGLYGFEQGGLLVEAGRASAVRISPLVARTSFPAEWRFLLVRPRGGAGLSGAEEVGGFARLPPMPLATTERLCRIALTELLPAVIERDFTAAANSIGEFGRLVGESFAPVQGGVFADPQMRTLAPLLERRGWRGCGQSSWGPTLFVLCPGSAAATELSAELKSLPECAGCELTIASALNCGASISK
jgi:beta-RFAP synthase